MKYFLFLAACLFAATPLSAEDPAARQAEVTRSVSGNILDEKGFSKGTVSLKKGDVFEVAAESVANVTLKDGEKLIQAPGDAVKITEVSDDEAVVGSSLRIVSAKMGFPNDREYEVKQEIKKLIKKRLDKAPITAAAPLEIRVTDELLRAKAKAATYTSRTNSNGYTVVYRRPGSIYLLITYEFDGKRLEKVGKEGNTISLP